MDLVRCVPLVLVSLILCNCSSVPPLEHATGARDSPIFVRDVVQRVKCEISDAFDDIVDDPRFYWLQNWTAKIDLTLQVNYQLGVGPTVSYTKFYHNAFNFDAGSSSLTSKVIQAVQQSLTLSGGANFNEQAQRAETVTFSLSFRELKAWRRRTRARRFADEEMCDPRGRELRGHLGLREWVGTALYPVATYDLLAGEHPSPGSGPSKPPSGGTGPRPRAAIRDIPIEDAKVEVRKSADAANASARDSEASLKAVSNSLRNVQSAMQNTIGPFYPILTDELKATLATLVSSIETAQEYVRKDVERADEAERKIKDLLDTLNSSEPGTTVSYTVILDARDYARNAAASAKHAKDLLANVGDKEKAITDFKPNPPIDGLLHSVQFIVTYGANFTANWSLIHWKGPGISGQLASGTGVRTHTLNIALGPPGEQNRLIQNITVLNAVMGRPQ